MKRFLKRQLNQLLPDVIRGPLKRRLAAKFVEPVSMKFVVEKEGPNLRCRIDNRWSFLVPTVCQMALANFTDSVEGRFELSTIVNAAQKGGILFDVGAHSGLVSATFCAVNPRNVAFSFEPSVVLAERLRSVRDLNQLGHRMFIEHTGIGATSGNIEMILDPAGGFVQAQRFDHTMWAAPKAVSVAIETIEDASARLNAVPQFIKIDIEGYEFEAISGSVDFLTRYKPAIFLEIHLNYLEERNLSAKTLVEMLQRCGYEFYTFGGTPLKAREVYDSPLPIIHVMAR